MTTTKTLFAYGTKTSVQIVGHWCNGCNIPYGLPEGFIEDRRRDGKSWTCPNGCVRCFRKTESQIEAERLTAELDAARSLARREAQRRERAEGQARLSEYQRRAAKGQLTKTKKRIAAGVCPCCNRTFQDLGKHLAGQHPDYAQQDT